MATAYQNNVAQFRADHPLDRLRYRLLLGVVLAILMPVGVREIAIGTFVLSGTQSNTAFGGILALVFGYIGYRKLHVFPGIAAGGYIFTSFSITFGVLAIALIFLRIDYSRIQFAVSYMLTVAIFTFIHLRIDVHKKLMLGVIPGGATDRLPLLRQVVWHDMGLGLAGVPRLHGIVADLHHDHSDAWDSQITRLVLQGTPVYDVRQAMEQLTGRVEVNALHENTLGSLNPNDVFLRLKGMVDVLCAAVAVVILSPIMAVVAIGVKIDSPGPALFQQTRVGFRARPFTVHKFRTMRVSPCASSPDDARSHAITQANDPRITRFGAFLRRSRLDELPQLFNILKGEMSLIGPRPEAIPLSQWYEKEIPFYHYRHIIKPGVTGWAQINQGHVSDVHEVREKLNLDFYYVKNFSFWLDVLIVLGTIRTVITGKGAR